MQGQLRSANVGDSGYMLLTEVPGGGRYEVRYHTPQQEHSFGCPYQLGHYEGADAPEDAMLMTLPVSHHSPAVPFMSVRYHGSITLGILATKRHLRRPQMLLIGPVASYGGTLLNVCSHASG